MKRKIKFFKTANTIDPLKRRTLSKGNYLSWLGSANDTYPDSYLNLIFKNK